MRGGFDWLLERDTHIIAMYRAGMTTVELGHEFILTARAICKVLAKRDVARRHRGTLERSVDLARRA